MQLEGTGGTGLGGRVLAAAEDLLDPNFARTVVFLVEHHAHGALGVVLNRPLGKTMADVVVHPDRLAAPLLGVPVLQGGPVQPEGLLLGVFERGESDEDIRARIDLAPDEVAGHVNREGSWVCAFMGYAGWGEGQLDGEMAARAWRVCAPHPVLFDPLHAATVWQLLAAGDNRWRRLYTRMPREPGRN